MPRAARHSGMHMAECQRSSRWWPGHGCWPHTPCFGWAVVIVVLLCMCPRTDAVNKTVAEKDKGLAMCTRMEATASLRVVVQPSAKVQPGIPLMQPVLILMDACGAVADFDHTTVVTATATGGLSGAAIARAASGVVQFRELVVTGTGPGTIRFTSSSLPPVESIVIQAELTEAMFFEAAMRNAITEEPTDAQPFANVGGGLTFYEHPLQEFVRNSTEPPSRVSATMAETALVHKALQRASAVPATDLDTRLHLHVTADGDTEVLCAPSPHISGTAIVVVLLSDRLVVANQGATPFSFPLLKYSTLNFHFRVLMLNSELEPQLVSALTTVGTVFNPALFVRAPELPQSGLTPPPEPLKSDFISAFVEHAGTRPGFLSDKYPDYFDIYTRHIREVGVTTRLLEIGVSRGGGLQVWRRFLGPSVEIFGLDLAPECADLQFDDPGIRVFVGDQANVSFLESVVAEAPGGFDVVVDDGGHYVTPQRTSFETLFPHVRPGGVYLVEDTGTSYLTKYGGDPHCDPHSESFVEYAKRIADDLHLHFVTEEGVARQVNALSPWIDSVTFYQQVVVFRKRRTPRELEKKPPRLVVSKMGLSFL